MTPDFMNNPGNGALITPHGTQWRVQWNGTTGAIQTQYHNSLDGAHRNAQRATKGHKGRHAAMAIADERLAAPHSSTGRRVAK